MGKIGIKYRNPFLGAEKWIEEEIKKANNDKEEGSSEIKETNKKIKVEK